MAEPLPERRDIQGILTQIQVDVATIKERSLSQGNTLTEMKAQIGGVVFREEYERRHGELLAGTEQALAVAKSNRDDQLRRQGAERVWRVVLSMTVAVIGLVEVWAHH